MICELIKICIDSRKAYQLGTKKDFLEWCRDGAESSNIKKEYDARIADVKTEFEQLHVLSGIAFDVGYVYGTYRP